MKVHRLRADSFIQNPGWGYASYITDPEQLVVCHCHDYYEIFLVKQGAAVHRVNGGQTRISTGALYIMRPDDVHYYEKMTSNFQIINMIVTPHIMDGLFQYLGPGFDSGRLLYSTLPPHTEVSDKDITWLMGEFEKLELSKKVFRSRSETTFRITLLQLVVRFFPLVPARVVGSIPEWLRWLSLEMSKKENFTEGIPALHRLSGKSIEHVSRMCKKYLNKTPTELVNDLRLEYAARQLVISEAPVIDICEDAGFDSLSHFYHLFKSCYGIAPKGFRQNAAAMDLREHLPQQPHASDIREGVPLKSVLPKSG